MRILRLLLTFSLLALTSFTALGRDLPIVEFETNMGIFQIEVYPEAAPVSVKNFLTYVDGGFYDDTIFHRTIPGFMIQGGGFSKEMKKKPVGEPIKNESSHTPSNQRGTIALARTSDPDSATSQFFINVIDNPYLNNQPGKPGYAVFGKVTGGMEVVDRIAQTPTRKQGRFANLPVNAVLIKKAKLINPAKQ